MNGKKKNLSIIVIAILNFVLAFLCIVKLKTRVPINIFATGIDRMVSKYMLLILPVITIIISIIQVIYRLNTMHKVVTVGKLIEDGAFGFIDSTLVCANWILIYMGYAHTISTYSDLNIKIPMVYVVIAIFGALLMGIYSTFPINKKGSIIGLRTKETLEDDEIWRVANRFNGFTGAVSAITIMLTALFFIAFGFNYIVLALAIIICAVFMYVLPVCYAQRAKAKKEQRVVE